MDEFASTGIETPVETTLKLQEPELEYFTKRERCDLCGFQAYYRISFEAGFLFFCRHHYMEKENVFFEKALDIVDESELL
jgi:hypothetical protein